ncbi:MAG: hypothetical protein Kow0089_03300 [Desulfobulbaceae bacterium]
MLDSVTIDYQVAGAAVMDISVLRGGMVTRTLAMDREVVDESGTVAWDGRDLNGNQVADGDYQVQVLIRDPCGNREEQMLPVTVDTTPPTVRLDQVGTGEIFNVMLSVTGTVQDPHLAGFSLEARDEAGIQPTVTINEGSRNVIDNWLGTWNTAGLEGTWALVLTAEDQVGNKASTALPVSFTTRETLIRALEANPRLFSPNGDGTLESTAITYTLADTANISLVIENTQGNRVAGMSMENVLPGDHVFQWGGVMDSGGQAPDGTYSVRVTAQNLALPFVLQTETIPLTLDSTPPEIELSQPLDSSFVPGTVHVQGLVDDPSLQAYSVTLIGEETQSLLSSAATGSEVAFSRTIDLPDGPYTLRVEADDDGENTASRTVAFTVDTTRPVVRLESPGQEEFYGLNRPVVQVRGTVEEVNLQTWTVQYGPGADPDQWFDIASGEGMPGDGILASWPVGSEAGLEDGDYTIRFQAVDKAGWKSETRVLIHIDNTLPALDLTFPQEGGFVTGPFAVTGRVGDRFLKKFTLEMSDAKCGEGGEMSPLRTGTEEIQGTLAALDSLPPDGPACLRLTAADQPGNRAQVEAGFTIDTTPPAPPMLAGRVENTGVFLEWQPGEDPDIDGYNLYRDSERLNDVLLPVTTFTDPAPEEGEHVYTVRAVDRAGWESRNSNRVTLRVDFEPPDAMISAPRDGFLVGNYVDVMGRAWSADDFREYRLFHGEGEHPGSWELLRISPVPVGQGLLARWDLLDVPDGPRSLKLEAEDLSGNVNTVTVTVTVDNTPPAPPVLLSATPDGPDVDLAWQANQESDLAGYLLLRDGQPVNSSGMITDLLSSLVTGLSFRDPDVPDGVHEYSLAAVDLAGNMSDLSNTLQVTLDTHPPHLRILTPVSGLEFDRPLPVRADSEDTDIAAVRFQYRCGASLDWTDFGPELTGRPFAVELDPQALGWDWDTCYLRAVATDRAGQTDPAPEEVTVVYRDVTPPAPPTGAAALVKGGTVTLSWEAGPEEDLAGWNVYQYERLSNTTLLTDLSWTVPGELADGEYAFTITAVDTAANESEPVPVTALVFTPVLDQPWPEISSSTDVTLGGTTLPEVTVTLFADRGAGDVLAGMGTTDGDGRFAFPVTLVEGETFFHVLATDGNNNVSCPSNRVRLVHDPPPAAPTGLVAAVDGRDTALSWNPNIETDLAGYHLYRTDGGAWQRITTAPLVVPSFTDTGLKNGEYRYRVTAIDDAGGESAPSPEVAAVVEQGRPAAPTDLVATPDPAGAAIDLCWTPSADPVAGYLLLRGATTGGPYSALRDTPIPSTCFHDSGLVNGKTFFYVVRAVDTYGNESDPSNEAVATPEDTLAPDRPLLLLPTISGRPYQSPAAAVTVGGMAEPGSRVDLYRDDLWVDATIARSEAGETSLSLGEAVFYETVVTPDGAAVFYSQRVDTATPYSYEYHTFRRDLASGAVQRVDAIPEGAWEHHVSPDGTMILYNYEDEAGLVRIGLYDIAADTARPLTQDQDVEEWEPSWSGDGTKIVFDGDRGDGFYDVWVHDVASGVTSRVTTNIDGSYPVLSHDGTRVAFLAWDLTTRTYTLQVMNTDGTGAVTLAGNSDWTGYYPSMDWSPSGHELAFAADLEGTVDIYVYDADTGETRRVTTTPDVEINPRWSPDGKFLAWRTYGAWESRVWTAPVRQEGEARQLLVLPGSIDMDFLWLPPGIFFRIDSDLHQLVPPGHFFLESVPLRPGENLFTATAEDAAGNLSEPSGPISVTVASEDMADLEVLDQDIFVLPAAPLVGEQTTCGVVVRNISSTDAENVAVELYLLAADGSVTTVLAETLPLLAAGAEKWLGAELDTTGLAGSNTIFAFLDPDNTVAESREDNNVAARDFYVGEEAGLFVESSLNGREFRHDELATVEVLLHNSGASRRARLQVAVEDAGGAPVENLADLFVEPAYGSNETFTWNWRAGSVLAGEYRVRVTLRDGEGSVIGENILPFTVLSDIDVAAVLTTDKAKYSTDEVVRFALDITNTGANAVLDGLVVRLTIEDDSSTLSEEELPLSPLFPGDSARLTTTWNTGSHPPGPCTARFTVTRGATLLAEGAAPFEIEPVMALAGAVQVEPPVLFPDTMVETSWSVTSRGNIAPGPVTLRLVLTRSGSPAPPAMYEEVVTLDRNDTRTGRYTWSGPLLVGMYRVSLEADLPDGTRTLGDAVFTVRDGVPPLVTVLAPEQNGVLAGPVTMRVRAEDGDSGVATVEYSIDGIAWLPLFADARAPHTYISRWLPSEEDEGPHVLRFRATDQAGNTSPVQERSIVLEPAVDLALATEKDTFTMNEDVKARLAIINTGWEKRLRVTARVEDGQGVAKAVPLDRELILGADSTTNLDFTWNTGATDPGPYRISATGHRSGPPIARTEVPVTVTEVFALDGSLALSESSVPAGTPLRGDWTVRNSGNMTVENLLVEAVLSDQAATPLQTWSETRTLAKGESTTGGFSIDTDTLQPGAYQVGLRAAAAAGEVVFTPASFTVIDAEPPQVSLLAPLPGTLVDGPLEIAAVVVDESSGVATAEYRVDTGRWLPLVQAGGDGDRYTATWTPTAADEGGRLIAVRARDFAGNLSEEVTVGVTVRLCDPFTRLEGGLAVTPQPLYGGQDAVVKYTFVNRCDTPLESLNSRIVVRDAATDAVVFEPAVTTFLAPGATVTGSVVLPGAELAAGNYRTTLSIYRTGETRELAEITFEVLPGLEVVSDPLDRTDLLVWLNTGHGGCKEKAGRDERDDEGEQENERKGFGSCADRCAAYEHLERALARAADDLTIVCDRKEFEDELRSPFHTDIAIIGNRYPLTGHHDRELREKVFSGTGLLALGWHPGGGKGNDDDGDRREEKTSWLGIAVRGVLPGPHGPVRLVDSPVSAAGELELEARMLKVRAVEDALVAGWVKRLKDRDDDHDDRDDRKDEGDGKRRHRAPEAGIAACHDGTREYPALVLHDYGLGRTMFTAFNPCRAFSEENEEQLSGLIAAGLAHVHRAGKDDDPAPHLLYPYVLNVTGRVGREVTVNSVCADGLPVYDHLARDWVAHWPWSVTFPLGQGETALLPYSLLAPDREGAFPCTFRIGTSSDGGFTEMDRVRQEFTVSADRTRRLEAAIEALENFPATGRDRARREYAARSLRKVMERSVEGRQDTEKNIRDIGRAVDALRGIRSVDTETLRQRLDTLLRIEQGRWYLYE